MLGRRIGDGWEWTLWSGRVGLPKLVEPLFITTLDELDQRINRLRGRWERLEWTGQTEAALDCAAEAAALTQRREQLRAELHGDPPQRRRTKRP